ncbi:uncharacterized protein NPIL_92911 [Nephila pilipes]|uniref:Uncharacterized protein n=1 Tax=Nephila pilipes TaxID=299642 RepID=A0A8X6K8U2_NEPPI|nr:uncharacterized protein NPIL_92911 [Nephila pilipes]
MAYGKNSLSTVVITALILLYETSEARPNMDYSYESSNIPSGVLRPISGAVPVSVRKEPPSGPESRVLRAIRRKIDKNHVSELDYSIQADLFQDVQIPDGCSDTYQIRDGVVKHLLRGSRDIIVAVFRDVKDLMDNNLDGLPLAPNVVNGVSRAITDVMCGAEDVASDVTNSFDTLTDIITGFRKYISYISFFLDNTF